MNDDDVVLRLKLLADKHGGINALARYLKVNQGNLSRTIHRITPLPPAIIAALGLRKEVRYVEAR